MQINGRDLKYMKVYEGIWKYMEVFKVYPDMLKKTPEGRKGREGEGKSALENAIQPSLEKNINKNLHVGG